MQSIVPFLEKHVRDVEPRFQPHHVEVTAELYTVLLKDVVTQYKPHCKDKMPKI